LKVTKIVYHCYTYLILVLIKFCTLTTRSHVVQETHYTWANSTRMRRLGYRACKAWFQVIMPHKSLKFLSPHSVVHFRSKAKKSHLHATWSIRGGSLNLSCEWSTLNYKPARQRYLQLCIVFLVFWFFF
jgi:hypothetical protein